MIQFHKWVIVFGTYIHDVSAWNGHIATTEAPVKNASEPWAANPIAPEA